MTYWPYKPTPYDDLFRQYGTQYGIEPGLLRTIAGIESNFDPRAVSGAGARGLFQFMENTGPSYGLTKEEDYYDPAKSTHAGAKYLKELYDRFGDWDKARAAYNMGPTRLAKLGGDWSGIPETVEYNKRFAERYKGPGEDKVIAAMKRVSSQQGRDGGPAPDPILQAAERIKGEALADPVLSAISRVSQEGGSREYENPYPRGSREYFEYGRRLGMQPSIRPSTEVSGEPIPGTTVPTQWGGVDAARPLQYKARLVRQIDPDTFELEEMGTGETFPLRLTDIQAPELSTEAGSLGREYISSLLEEGDQLTIESEYGATGKYGRDLGKVYVTKNGRTIDLSTPFDLGDDKLSPHFGDEEQQEGLGAFARASARAASMEAVELGQLAVWGADVASGKGTPESLQNMGDKLEAWRQSMENAQAAYVAGGWSPDDKVYDVPGIGRVTMNEMGRALGTSAAYTMGLTWGAGKLFKLARFGTKAVRLAQKTPDVADMMARVEKGTREWEVLQSIKNNLIAEGVKGSEATLRLDNYIQKYAKTAEEAEKLVHLVEPIKPWQELTWGQRFGQLKDLYITHATDKYHPIMALARKLSPERTQEAMPLLNMLRAASDVENSVLTVGVPRHFKDADNVLQIDPRANEALEDIWQGVRGPELYMNGAYMATERLLEDIAPRWDELVRLHGERKAFQIARKEGLPIVTDADRIAANKVQRMIRDLYRDMPDGADAWKGAQDRMFRMRQWEDAVLQQLKDVGFITEKDIVKMRAKGGKYVRFTRLNYGLLEEVMGKAGIDEMLALERDMLRGDKAAAIMGRNLSAASTQARPVSKLTGSLGDDVKKMIMDPFQGAVVRGPKIQRAVNQQHVRNLMGEMIEEAIERGDDYGQYLGRTIRITTDEKVIAKIIAGKSERGFIRYKKLPGDKVKKVAYLVDDPALAEVIKVMSPAQMSMFKVMMQSPVGRAVTAPTRLFRAGTVLGLSFMIRNPIRDQLMAATLTKYGYVPVIDWFRGLYHVTTRSELYKGLHGAGATQASFLSDDIMQTTGKVRDLETGETLSQLWHKLMRKELGDDPITLKRIWAAIGESRRYAKARATGTRFSAFSPNEVDSPSGLLKSRFREAPGAIKDSASGAMYGLRRISEIAEEATRTGAAARAISRAKKGKKYTVMRSVDEAFGGLSGWYRMIADPKHRAGFMGRYRKARYAKSPYSDVRVGKKGAERHMLIDQDIQDEVRNITLDFQRKGITGETLNALYPFFNAELQDYARFGRALREAPLTTAARAFSFVTLPALANWYLNFDDPEYQNESDIEKELFMHPFGMNPEFKKFGRISRPIGSISASFGLLPHKMLDHLAANNPAAIKSLEEQLWPGVSMRRMRDNFREGAVEATQAMPQSLRTALALGTMGYFPMHGMHPGSGQQADVLGDPSMQGLPFLKMLQKEGQDYLRTNTLLNSRFPQALSPMTSVMTNEDYFFDSPVVPPRLMEADMLPEDTYTERTMPLEKLMASALRAATPFEVNPIQAGFLWRRYTGSVGSMLLGMADQAGRTTGVIPERPAVPPDASTANPLVKPFYGRQPVGGNSKPVRDLYDEWERMEQVLNSMEHTKSVYKADRLVDIMKDHPEWAAASLLEKAVGDLAAIHKARRQVLDDPNMPDDQRADALYALDQGMTQYAYVIMMAYNKMVRDPSLMQAMVEGR